MSSDTMTTTDADEPPDGDEDELSDNAHALLDSLSGGDGRDIAVPSVYPGVEAFCDHARAYFNNAAMLCRAGESHDFAVFGARPSAST